jgi:hypothetical protein
MISRRFFGVLGLLLAACLTGCTKEKYVSHEIEGFQEKGIPMLDDVLRVTISGAGERDLLRAPVQAIVAIKNISEHRIQILLPYPNPNNLSFECKSVGLAIKKQVERDVIERTVPINIDPQESYTAVYYLNRYLSFQRSGDATVSYRLELLLTTNAGTDEAHHKTVQVTGEFTVYLIEPNEEELRNELAKYAAKLDSSNRQVRSEAAEALGFLDTPVCVDYVARMLSVDNLEVMGIRALGRFPSAKTSALIIGMLSHKESAVVSAALDVINAQNIRLPRQRIQSLLTSDNASIRLLALEWLVARPDQADRESVSRLLNDVNAVVREKAATYIEKLDR